MGNLFSIRYKFLVVTTLLLLFCVAAYLYMATTVFKRDKTELVFEYNRSSVSNVASDVESLFSSVEDKMRLAAHFLSKKSKRQSKFVRTLIANSSEIVFLASSYQLKEMDKVLFQDPSFLNTYGVDSDYFVNKLQSSKPVPFEEILVEGQAIWNATLEGGPPLIGFGKNVIEEDSQGRPKTQFAIVTFVKVDRLVRTLSAGQINEIFIANDKGEIVAHDDPDVLKEGSRENLKELTEKAIDSKFKVSVVNFEKDGDEILGAFARAFHDKLVVVSKVESSKAFAAVNRLVYRSVLFAAIVLTLAFIAAILFSQSLTRPLDTLMDGMKNVAEGDLNTSKSVSSKDEIRVLANSFNNMIKDLRSSRKELEEINRDLEDKVKERTAQLEKQNQAVKSAQEALLRSTRLAAVGEIAGRAAHEVLNPLTNIMTRVQNIKAKTSNEDNMNLFDEITEAWKKDFGEGGFEKLIENWKQPSSVNKGQSLWEEDLHNLAALRNQLNSEHQKLSKDVEFVLKEGNRINRIVQSMRSLSIVKGDVKNHKVLDLIEESKNIMADLASKFNVSIELQNKVGDAFVSVDYDEFIQSLTNLLRNSIQSIQEKTNGEGNFKGLIKILALQEDGKIKIKIVDNGTGIAPENQKKLFEKQFSTKSKDEGTGLGLNICRRFIRSFNGDIYLGHSENGVGSTFVIELPVSGTESKESA